MKPSTKKSAGWTAIRRALTTQEKPALIALIKDLHDAAEANRDLLQARCVPAENEGELLEKFRRKIVEQFFPAEELVGKLKLGEARKAIRDYRKATGSVSGTAELLMCYVENGAEFTRAYGDIDERFYSSIESALEDLAVLLRRDRALYPSFADRLSEVKQTTRGMGWGFHDFISDVVEQLEEELGAAPMAGNLPR